MVILVLNFKLKLKISLSSWLSNPPLTILTTRLANLSLYLSLHLDLRLQLTQKFLQKGIFVYLIIGNGTIECDAVKVDRSRAVFGSRAISSQSVFDVLEHRPQFLKWQSGFQDKGTIEERILILIFFRFGIDEISLFEYGAYQGHLFQCTTGMRFRINVGAQADNRLI